MELSQHERLMIISLSSNPGFQLLLESLESDAADLLEAVEFAEDDAKEKRLVANWRALRHVIGTVKARTEEPEINRELDDSLSSLHGVTQGNPDFGRMVTGEEE